jgi:hypothetical protein
MREIGKLNFVNPRELWEHEAADFTPWLSDNLDELSKSLGMDLEILNSEEQVGSFFCDVYARDKRTGRIVIIENQLEETNHSHLGQLLTYASGLDAKVICWISPKFRDEHLAALNWLNNATSDDIRFLAVRLRAGRIDNSKEAPLFEVLASPNVFQRSAKREREKTVLRKRREAFWKEVLTRASALGLCKDATSPSERNYQAFKASRSGFRYDLVFTEAGAFSIELYITHKRSKEFFGHLENDKIAIENELGFELSWQLLEHAHACRIAYEKPDIDEIADREELIEWSLIYLPKMKSAFDPRILKLMEN